ncbi:hypothetical protein Syun_016391 [Stephania yunnanensis]|uniref:Uncharacterized protein n=1 Tax=Stephania yunnanensis TaxID=152371 RepID=A0AAP0J536_9MAGN
MNYKKVQQVLHSHLRKDSCDEVGTSYGFAFVCFSNPKEGDYSDSGSGTGSSRGRAAEARSLPQIKDNVKDVMFYC